MLSKAMIFSGLILALSTSAFASANPQDIANEAADGFCRAFVKTWAGHENIPVKGEGALRSSTPTEYQASCHNTDADRNHIFNAEIRITFSPLGALDSVKLISVAE